MPVEVRSRLAFHVTRALSYNSNPPLSIGCEFTAGKSHNPFFGFYEGARTYDVTLENGDVAKVPAIKFLNSVKNGKINCPALPQIAADVAQHYVILARELIMEETRKDIAPNAPSRKDCLWVADTIEEARLWKSRLGGDAKITHLQITGSIHRADAGLLLGDSEPLSTTYAKAQDYWRGNLSERPELETLFKGNAIVIDFLE